MKEQNMQTFMLRPIFASIHVQKWTPVKYDLFRRLARDRKSPWQRRNRSLIFSGKTWFGEKSVRQTACLQWYFMQCFVTISSLNVNRNLHKVVYTKLETYSAEIDDIVFLINLSFYQTNLQSSPNLDTCSTLLTDALKFIPGEARDLLNIYLKTSS